LEGRALANPASTELRPSFCVSSAQFFTCAIEKLIARRDFVHQPHLQSFLSGIKFAFKITSAAFSAPINLGNRVQPPQAEEGPGSFGKPISGGRSSDCDAIIAGERNLVTAASRRAMGWRQPLEF